MGETNMWQEPYTEPAMMGTCRCCGQKKVVPDAMSQAEADLEATRSCTCSDGVSVRRQIAEKDTVAEMLPDVEEQVRGYVLETAQLIRKMDLAAVTIRLDEISTVKLKAKDGAVTITRTNKAERNGVL